MTAASSPGRSWAATSTRPRSLAIGRDRDLDACPVAGTGSSSAAWRAIVSRRLARAGTHGRVRIRVDRARRVAARRSGFGPAGLDDRARPPPREVGPVEHAEHAAEELVEARRAPHGSSSPTASETRYSARARSGVSRWVASASTGSSSSPSRRLAAARIRSAIGDEGDERLLGPDAEAQPVGESAGELGGVTTVAGDRQHERGEHGLLGVAEPLEHRRGACGS